MKPFFLLMYLLMALAGLITAGYGLYLAFSASVILGILVLIVEPLPLLIGATMLIAHVDVAQKFLELIKH